MTVRLALFGKGEQYGMRIYPPHRLRANLPGKK